MYQFSVAETAPTGTAVGRVKAEDADVGENTDMMYQIKDEEGVELFRVTTDSNTQEAVVLVQKVSRGQGGLGWAGLSRGGELGPGTGELCPARGLRADP